MSHCMPDGSQRPGRKVYFYMPPCAAVWHGGTNNGGATMTGVSARQVRYVIYMPQSNAAVSAVLSGAGASETPEQFCAALTAFNHETQSVFETYGRTLVPLDGPGNNAGSKTAKNGCHFPFYQSTCASSPPDLACMRADAKTMAAMKPAIVLAPLADTSLYDELAANHIVVVTGNLLPKPRSYYQRWAPYVYTPEALDGDANADMAIEYYCKRLVGQKAIHGGADVQKLPYGNRHLGVVYGENGGNPAAKLVADDIVAGV
jgi:hypothetical protein